jgi:serine acetyltransferase
MYDTIIKENINVNESVVFGAKSLVLSSPDDCSTYYGVPAKKRDK